MSETFSRVVALLRPPANLDSDREPMAHSIRVAMEKATIDPQDDNADDGRDDNNQDGAHFPDLGALGKNARLAVEEYNKAVSDAAKRAEADAAMIEQKRRLAQAAIDRMENAVATIKAEMPQ